MTHRIRAGRLLCSLALCGALGACGRDPAPSPAEAAQAAARAASLRPADDRLAGLYDHSCRACHANAQANAPLTGDRRVWRARLKKGRSELVRNVLTGFNGMPPGGQCFSCTTPDIEALIAFMSN